MFSDMCGRYSADLKWDDVAKLYDLSKQGPLPPWNFQPNYNVCPTDPVPVIVPNFDGRQLILMRWGLVPSWWSKPLKELRLATFSNPSEPSDANGSMYGTPEGNLEIEQFAMARAVAALQSRYPSATVVSQARNNPGFDILVTVDEKSAYVEVKGTRRPLPRFLITQGEVEFSRRYAPAYHLLIFYGIDLSTSAYRLGLASGSSSSGGVCGLERQRMAT
jgi:hypothetical protein